MKTHELKCHPEQFQAVVRGEKTHELRMNDRNFQVGDRVHLNEWCPDKEEYTGNVYSFSISNVTKVNDWINYAIPAEFVVLSMGGFPEENVEPAIYVGGIQLEPESITFKACKKLAVAYAAKMEKDFVVNTLEGKRMRGKAGDYLMRDHKGSYYPCDVDVFEESYCWVKSNGVPNATS